MLHVVYLYVFEEENRSSERQNRVEVKGYERRMYEYQSACLSSNDR